MPVHAETQALGLVSGTRGVGERGEGVVVDVELAVPRRDLERTPGPLLQIERLLGGRAAEAGLFAGEEVAGARLPGLVIELGGAGAYPDFLARHDVLAEHAEAAEP